MNYQNVSTNAILATEDFCNYLHKIPVDLIDRLGEEKILMLNHIHIMYTVQELSALIQGSDLIKCNMVSQINICELFNHLISIGMTPFHAQLTEDDGIIDFVFTREGMKFLNDNIKPFEELINIYLSALDITE